MIIHVNKKPGITEEVIKKNIHPGSVVKDAGNYFFVLIPQRRKKREKPPWNRLAIVIGFGNVIFYRNRLKSFHNAEYIRKDQQAEMVF